MVNLFPVPVKNVNILSHILQFIELQLHEWPLQLLHAVSLVCILKWNAAVLPVPLSLYPPIVMTKVQNQLAKANCKLNVDMSFQCTKFTPVLLTFLIL